MASFEKARVIQERLGAGDNPSVAAFRNDLAMTHNDIGILRHETGRNGRRRWRPTSEAQSRFRSRLTRENPSVTEFQTALALSHVNIGSLRNETGHPAEALASHELAHAIFERLARENPTVSQVPERLLAESLRSYIGVLQRGHRPDRRRALASVQARPTRFSSRLRKRATFVGHRSYAERPGQEPQQPPRRSLQARGRGGWWRRWRRSRRPSAIYRAAWPREETRRVTYLPARPGHEPQQYRHRTAGWVATGRCGGTGVILRRQAWAIRRSGSTRGEPVGRRLPGRPCWDQSQHRQPGASQMGRPA